MAQLIKPDGTVTGHTPARRHFSNQEICGLVEAPGGYLEAMMLDNGEVLYFHEEGKLRGLPANLRATAYAKVFNRRYQFTDDVLVGNVLVCARTETS